MLAIFNRDIDLKSNWELIEFDDLLVFFYDTLISLPFSNLSLFPFSFSFIASFISFIVNMFLMAKRKFKISSNFNNNKEAENNERNKRINAC